jgi:hypothetical protein
LQYIIQEIYTNHGTVVPKIPKKQHAHISSDRFRVYSLQNL